MSELDPNELIDTSPPGTPRNVSRRRVVVAGALLAPLFLTMKVPALHAGRGNKSGKFGPAQVGSNASCVPEGKFARGSYDPSENLPVCGEDPGGPTGRVNGVKSGPASSPDQYTPTSLGWKQ